MSNVVIFPKQKAEPTGGGFMRIDLILDWETATKVMKIVKKSRKVKKHAKN